MRNLYKKYEEGGIGDPKKDENSTFDILGSLVNLIKEGGTEVVEALQDMLGQGDMDKALEEFNEKADRMPTDRGRARPGSKEGMYNVMPGMMEGMRPDRRDLPDMRKMTPREINQKNFVSSRSVFGNDDSLKSPGRNVGEGIDPRRRLFRRR
jgi:hypothetical protein